MRIRVLALWTPPRCGHSWQLFAAVRGTPQGRNPSSGEVHEVEQASDVHRPGGSRPHGQRRRVRAGEEGSDLRAPGHAGAAAHRDGVGRAREGYRLQDQLAHVRRRWRRHQGDGQRRRAARRSRLEPDHRGGKPGPGHQAVLDPRRHRRCRSTDRAQRQRYQQRQGPEGQEGRHAVRQHRALPVDGGDEDRRRRREGRERDEHAPARNRRGLGARRHRRRVHLGPGPRSRAMAR
jgi:hypothetical protein